MGSAHEACGASKPKMITLPLHRPSDARSDTLGRRRSLIRFPGPGRVSSSVKSTGLSCGGMTHVSTVMKRMEKSRVKGTRPTDLLTNPHMPPNHPRSSV